MSLALRVYLYSLFKVPSCSKVIELPPGNIGSNSKIILLLDVFRTEAEEYNENLHKVALLLRGECGLLFTNEKTDDVLEFFQNLAEPDFARYNSNTNEGCKGTAGFIIPCSVHLITIGNL